MKHPIAYRVVMYSCMAFLATLVILLVQSLDYAPFTSIDMRLAYLNGCLIADKTNTNKCKYLSELYFETLEDVDQQMEDLDE